MGADIVPTHQKLAARGRTEPGRVTGKLRIALDAMVWLGLPRKQAAEHAGLTEHGLYKALRKLPVRRYYLDQCEVLRVSGRARRLHRLEQIAESDRNMAASVAAIRASEDLGEDDRAPGRGFGPTSAGFVIVVPSTYLPKERPTIEDRPPIVDVTPEVQPPEPRPEPVPPAIARAAPRRR